MTEKRKMEQLAAASSKFVGPGKIVIIKKRYRKKTSTWQTCFFHQYHRVYTIALVECTMTYYENKNCGIKAVAPKMNQRLYNWMFRISESSKKSVISLLERALYIFTVISKHMKLLSVRTWQGNLTRFKQISRNFANFLRYALEYSERYDVIVQTSYGTASNWKVKWNEHCRFHDTAQW